MISRILVMILFIVDMYYYYEHQVMPSNYDILLLVFVIGNVLDTNQK